MRASKVAFFCLVTLVTGVLAGFPAPSVGHASSEYVEYNRSSTAYPVMNAATYQNTSFLSKWVQANGDSLHYNVVSGFMEQGMSSGAASIPDRLSFDTRIRHRNNDSQYRMYYYYDIEQALLPALHKGDMHVSFAATLHNDKHWNAKRHLNTLTAYPSTSLATADGMEIRHETKSYSRDGSWRLGANEFVPIPPPTWSGMGRLFFDAVARVCTCGSSAVSHICIMLADVVGPKVTSLYATNEAGEPATALRAGDALNIHLQFDEQIRFADDTAMLLNDAPTLKLRLRRVDDLIYETGISAEAKLIALSNDTLTFRYVVPETLSRYGTDIPVDHYIDAIESYDSQTSWISTTDDFDLKLLGRQLFFGQTRYLSHEAKTRSLIVDLAGNPINTGGSVTTLDRAPHLDTVPPDVLRVLLSSNRVDKSEGEEIGLGAVFAGIGERIRFEVHFSERVFAWRESDRSLQNLSGANLRAELNLTTTEGDPIIVPGRINSFGRWDNEVKRNITTVDFDVFITEAMRPLIYDGDTLRPIGINRIYLDMGEEYTIADGRGNEYNAARELINAPSGLRVMPRQQLWLDNIRPAVETDLVPSGNVYTPLNYEGAENRPEFYLPIRVLDPAGYGQSGVSGATGHFVWHTASDTGAHVFEFAITGSPDKPEPSSYQQGVMGRWFPFTQLPDNYIHIRLPDGVEGYSSGTQLQIYARDRAGNTGVMVFPIDFVLDRSGPEIAQLEVTRTLIQGGGRLRKVFTLKDLSEMQSIEYIWTGRGGTPAPDADWTAVTNYQTVNWGRYRMSYVAIDTIVPTGTNFDATIHIRGTDQWGNTSTASFTHQYHMGDAVYDIQFIANPSSPQVRHLVNLLPPDPAVVGNTAYEVVFRLHMDRVRLPVWPTGTQSFRRYWVRIVTFDQPPTDPINPIDILDPDDVSEWTLMYAYDHGTVNGVWSIFYRNWNTFCGAYDMEEVEHTVLSDMLNSYRQLELYISAYNKSTFDALYFGWEPWVIPTRFFAELPIPGQPMAERYWLNFASDALLAPDAKIHKATIEPLSQVSYDSFSIPGEVLAEIPSQLAMPRSLDGATFRVKLENQIVASAGLNDIDFASADTHFNLYKTGSGAPDTPVFTAPLVAKTEQDFVIPADVAEESGSYKVVVSIKARASGRIDTWEYTNISIDRREMDNYGPSRVHTEFPAWSRIPYLSTDYDTTAEGRAATLFANARSDTFVTSQSITFSADITSLNYNGQPHYATYIKVWNETVSALALDDPLHIPLENYSWVYIPGERSYRTEILTDENRDSIITKLGSSQANTAACLPLLEGENMVSYQIVTASGYRTPVQTVLVDARADWPRIFLNVTPHWQDGPTRGPIRVSLDRLSSNLVHPETLEIDLITYASGAEALRTAFKAGEEINITQRTDYHFMVIDRYHNIGSVWEMFDYLHTEPPSLDYVSFYPTSLSRSMFELQVDFEAPYYNLEEVSVYVGFDDDYSRLIGVELGTFYEIPFPDAWSEKGISQNGFFQASSDDAWDLGGRRYLTGAFKYDPSLNDDTVTRTVTVYAEDRAGNRSPMFTESISVNNSPAAYLSGQLVPEGFRANFSMPVTLIEPAEHRPVPGSFKVLPIFNNGVYPISFVDIFGNYHTDVIVVDHFDDTYNCSVLISETGPTNQDVEVKIQVNYRATLEFPSNISGAANIEWIRDDQNNLIGATITMAENGDITFAITPHDQTLPPQNRTVTIGNIDRTPAVVSLNWTYTADVIDGETAGDVVVSLNSNKDIVPLADTATSHVFRLDHQEPYTFHYSDPAGNAGSITAVLPVVIAPQGAAEGDITPPDYIMGIFRDGVRVDTFTQEAYEELEDKSEAFPLFSGVLQLRFTIFDDSQTWLTIEDATVPDRVLLSGTTISVTEDVSFTAVITDAHNNETRVPVTITSADNIPPTGTITYVPTTSHSVKAYLTTHDNRPEPVTVRLTNGVQLETVGEHAGKYYYEFTDNGSLTFHFVDAAGNNGSTVARVLNLDMSSPVGNITEWIPHFVDSRTHLSDMPTNSDVSVFIRFNKPIKSISASIIDYGEMEDISVSYTPDSAIVVFRQNASINLVYTAMNNRTGTTRLDVNIIDKVPPWIWEQQIAASPQSVTYRFTSNKPVYMQVEDDQRELKSVHERAFYLNGEYALTFVDEAGNSTTRRVSISGIDRTPPSITIAGLPATREAIAQHNQAHGTNLQHLMTNQPFTINVSLDEPGSISFRGVSHRFTSQPIPLAITGNGSYEIIATDLAGNTTRYPFRIDCIDIIAPQLLFPGGTLAIRQGITVEEFETQVTAHAIAVDNLDPSPTITVSRGLTLEQLDQPGTYLIELTARDRAGNARTGMFYVRVFDRNLPEVRVNGALVQPNETISVSAASSGLITVDVENLRMGPGGQEPYSVYWKAGERSAGQMKDATPFTGSFIAPRNGFFTIYIVTQSRATLLIHVFVRLQEVRHE